MTDVLTPRVVAATATTSTTATAGHHLPVDATAAPITITLPSAVNQGAYLSIEKADAGPNAVTISGTIHGGASTVTLTSQYETLTFSWLGATWEPLEGHRTKSAVDAAIDAKIAAQATVDATTYVHFGPTLPTLPTGTEYVWNKTDGAGTLLDIVSGVA